MTILTAVDDSRCASGGEAAGAEYICGFASVQRFDAAAGLQPLVSMGGGPALDGP
jgi:hypothetical protein